MSEIDDIKTKINRQKELEKKIHELDILIRYNKSILTLDEIEKLDLAKDELQKSLIPASLDLQIRNKDFLYSYEEISNANDVNWFIQNVVPKSSIGVFIGASGSGKSTVVLNFCKEILKNHTNCYIFYIDGDMSITKLKEIGIDIFLKEYKDRFNYAGKSMEYFSLTAQNLIQDIVEMQKKYQNRNYIVIEDSLSLIAKKKMGFIDTEMLYRNEKELRKYGGTSIIIHHTNKSGIFADSQHIENFADYTYLIERNDFNSCILMRTQKASRYRIENKAYSVENRKIVAEIDFEVANIAQNEVVFINYVQDALEDGEMNQSEIMNHLEKMRFFTEQKVGHRKTIKWLKKWADKGKWKFEQRVEQKNAIYYFLSDHSKTDKLEKLDKDKALKEFK